MRATISFEADIERVNDMMLALTRQESDALRSCAHELETTKPHELGKNLSTTLTNLQKVVRQLQQYKEMVVSFEKARFDTMIPQSVNTVDTVLDNIAAMKQANESLKNFDNFIEKITEDGGEDDDTAKG